MVIAIITEQKASELTGFEFQPGMFYNPVQLSDGRWFISFPEAQYLLASDIVSIEDYTAQDGNEI
ncbi:hypothetical protein J2X97_000346 [Epilithonimonas hungarica]|uniref:hypothetical protein n=1 Tax=Epilithonimonas hungarica TaxID=454006 RepID=UPI0027865F4E|nr:hypothetical protein [Epilithonimonas hungarica]MDP9954709.1 hypothetical protein [Epilithonimonas hungarica]